MSAMTSASRRGRLSSLKTTRAFKGAAPLVLWMTLAGVGSRARAAEPPGAEGAAASPTASSPTASSPTAAPCVLALPRVAALSRATVRSACGSKNGFVHDGDRIALGARGHLRMQAELEEGRALDVTCIGSSASLELIVHGAEAPWLTPEGAVTCGAWSNNERVCTSASGDEVLVCGAVARVTRSASSSARAAAPLGLPTWYVGAIEDAPADAVTTPTPGTPSTESAAGGREARRLTRIAVYPLAHEGIDERVARVMTASLVAELRKLQGVSVIGMDEISAMLDLEASKQLTGCDDSCLSEIAEALGVDVVLTGALSAIGAERFFSLKRIDQRAAHVAGQINERLAPGNGEEFLGVVGPSVEALFPDVLLKPGRARGVGEQLTVRLNPPPLDPWVFWSGVGVTGASLAATSVAGFLLFDTKQRYDATVLAPPASGTELNALRDFGQTLNLVTVVAAGVTVGFALVTATSAGFVDWQGYRDDLQLSSVQ